MSSAKVIDAETSKRLIDLLPHRYPFLFVDRIVEHDPGKQIVGLKNVTRNEPFFDGHFPGQPIMPGVLIVEAMVQIAAILVLDSLDNAPEILPIFTRIEKVRFRRPVVPGDQLLMEARLLRTRRPIWWFSGTGTVDGERVAEGEAQATMGTRAP
jgi:3-hydroxyacyl-[acyl-carrier-protein] dehydratase